MTDIETRIGTRHTDTAADSDYCLIDASRPPRADGPPFAECVLCRQPTEYPESYKGITLCPVCEWREAERTSCSG
ncbi:hypothetical protein [Streptomyces sp. NPDC029526]|uniref:hypothetical protein n=1 Tax=Streptomyces sp. NPDC029526 TaxID=3155728 RepID=UPI00340B7335